MAGQYEDAATGLRDSLHRAYSAALGQFVSIDPLHPWPEDRPYAYPLSPDVEVDPFGLMKLTGLTRSGQPRLDAGWRARYGPGAMRDHHVIPREFIGDVAAGLGIPTARARDLVDRTIARIPNSAHIDLHAAGYNAEWRAWFSARLPPAGPGFTRAELRSQMETMMQRHGIPRSSMNQPRYCR
jgi:RHS repeat-associated protein